MDAVVARMDDVAARMDAIVARIHTRVFLRRGDGQDRIEYSLPLALIAIVAMVAVGAVGTTVNTLFWETFQSAIASAV